LFALALAAALVMSSAPESRRESADVVLTHDKELLEDKAFLTAVRRGMHDLAPMPSGSCFLRLIDTHGRVKWTGAREYEFELKAPAGELVSVEAWRQGYRELRLEQLEDQSQVFFRIQVPLWGVHEYSIHIATRQGAMRPLEITLPGTLHLDGVVPDWLQR